MQKNFHEYLNELIAEQTVCLCEARGVTDLGGLTPHEFARQLTPLIEQGLTAKGWTPDVLAQVWPAEKAMSATASNTVETGAANFDGGDNESSKYGESAIADPNNYQTGGTRRES